MLRSGSTLAFTLLLYSCAPLFQKSSDTIVAREPSTQKTVSRAAPQDVFRAQSFLCGSRLTLVVTALHACEESSTGRVTVERRTVRDWSVPLVELGIGAAGVGVPVLLNAASPHSWSCGGTDSRSSDQCYPSTGAVVASAVSLVVGAGFVVAAAIDAARDKDIRQQYPSTETSRRQVWCGEAPAANRLLTLITPAGPLTTRIDSAGVARFELPQPVPPAGTTLSGSVDAAHGSVKLSADYCATP